MPLLVEIHKVVTKRPRKDKNDKALPQNSTSDSKNQPTATEDVVRNRIVTKEVPLQERPTDFNPKKKYFKMRFTDEYFENFDDYTKKLEMYRKVGL